jgi:hypothetical protein
MTHPDGLPDDSTDRLEEFAEGRASRIPHQQGSRMRRSEVIRALANRMGAHAASLLFPGRPELTKDLGQSSALLHEYAADVHAREKAAGRDVGHELAVLLSANGANTRLLPSESPPPAAKKQDP